MNFRCVMFIPILLEELKVQLGLNSNKAQIPKGKYQISNARNGSIIIYLLLVDGGCKECFKIAISFFK